MVVLFFKYKFSFSIGVQILLILSLNSCYVNDKPIDFEVNRRDILANNVDTVYKTNNCNLIKLPIRHTVDIQKAEEHYRIAYKFVKHEEYDSARFHYISALRYGFSNEDTLLFNIATISYLQGDYIDAINTINLALTYDSTLPNALTLRGSCYLVLGDTFNACIDYKNSYKKGNAEAELLFLKYCEGK